MIPAARLPSPVTKKTRRGGLLYLSGRLDTRRRLSRVARWARISPGAHGARRAGCGRGGIVAAEEPAKDENVGEGSHGPKLFLTKEVPQPFPDRI